MRIKYEVLILEQVDHILKWRLGRLARRYRRSQTKRSWRRGRRVGEYWYLVKGTIGIAVRAFVNKKGWRILIRWYTAIGEIVFVVE